MDGWRFAVEISERDGDGRACWPVVEVLDDPSEARVTAKSYWSDGIPARVVRRRDDWGESRPSSWG